MHKIKEIIIGTNNKGKYREICSLIPRKIKKYSPGDFNLKSPPETGNSFNENSFIKASYFSQKTNLVCISDDSGLEIDILDGQPGIYSARWSGKKNNFDLAIKKVFKKMNNIKKNCESENNARFICSMTLYLPDGKSYLSTGLIKGKISIKKKGNKGFGYDPIFIPDGYKKTFGEMSPKLKMSIDHRFKAFRKLKKYFI
tara:strand:+ start:75 stop:671 length:597 start_codon:yes stop_codon:yes gene_type:complete